MSDRIQEIATTNKSLEVKATSLKIVNQESYEMAADILKAVKAQDKAIHEILDPGIEAANSVHKGLTAQRKGYLDPLATIEKTLKTAMGIYITEQERLRLEEQRKLIAQQQEEERKQRAAQKEKEDLLREMGMDEEAQEVSKTEILVEEVKLPPKVETAGIGYREVWKFEVLDKKLIPNEFMTPDEAKIRQYVTAMKSDADIPGVRVYAEKSVVVR